MSQYLHFTQVQLTQLLHFCKNDPPTPPPPPQKKMHSVDWTEVKKFMKSQLINCYNTKSESIKYHILLALNMGTCISWLWWWAGWPISFCRPTSDTPLANTNRVTNLGEDGEKKDELTGNVKIRTRKKFLTVSKACGATFWPTIYMHVCKN